MPALAVKVPARDCCCSGSRLLHLAKYARQQSSSELTELADLVQPDDLAVVARVPEGLELVVPGLA